MFAENPGHQLSAAPKWGPDEGTRPGVAAVDAPNVI